MEVLPHDKFVVRIDGSRRLTRRDRRFLRLYNPVSTNIETKVFNGWHKNLSSSNKSTNVSHQHDDSSVEVTEDSNGANTDETREIDRDELSEHIPAPPVPMVNKVPLALRRYKDFNAPGKLESGLLQ